MQFQNDKRVVITGVGPLSSIGSGKNDFWNAILNRKTNVSKETFKIDGEIWDSFYSHKIKNFDINNYHIDPSRLEEIKLWKNNEVILDLFYLIAVTNLALEDSGLIFDNEYNDIGLVLSHENPGLDQFAEKSFNVSYEILNKKINSSKKEFFNEAYQKCHKTVYDLQTFMFLFHVGKTLGIHGCSFFLNNACASGLYALEEASLMIKGGHCPAVIIGASDYPDIYKYLWFKSLGMYARDGKIKPFSSRADGFVFGDGGAGIVLEDLGHALNRGANIYAEYLGGSFTFEGWKVAFPAVGRKYYVRTINKVLEKLNLSTNEIDLIVPHGVGLKISDQYEAEGLIEIFGKNERPFYSAFKPYIGHNLGASSLLETIILILGIKNQVIPPTLNCENKDKETLINLITDTVSFPINNVIKTVSAFAGFDGVVVLRKFVQ